MAAYSLQEMDSNYMIKVMIKVFVVLLIIQQPVLSAEMLRNVALGKPVTLSTTLGSYTQSNASSAVDGRISRDINNCWCCVSTLSEENPWLTVDLGEEYLPQKVVVIGRSDYGKNQISRNLTNLRIFNGNRTSRGQLVEQMQIKMVNNTATAENLDQFLRLITLRRPRTESGEWFLTVCEIEIYVLECPSGQYGNGVCNKTCGHCKNGSSCDGVTGQCRVGCDPGYVGNTCTQECTSGTYGNCSQKCGQCKGGNCHKVTGRCPTGCNLGYMGERCDQECLDGTYGNCNQTCGHCKDDNPCDKMTGGCPEGCKSGYMGVTCQDCAVGYYVNCSQFCGNCTEGQSCDQADGSCPGGCSPGYKGYTCHEECDPGQYGNNCSEMCGHCRRRQSCNHVTGYCQGSCDSGYRGDKCHEECFSGTYGPNCSQSCGQCFGNETCHHINGTCTFGCRVDFIGDLCQETADKQNSHMATAAVSVSVCAIAAAVTVIVAVRVMRRKRMLRSSRNRSTYEVPVWHAHRDESAYSVLDNTRNLCTTDNTNT